MLVCQKRSGANLDCELMHVGDEQHDGDGADHVSDRDRDAEHGMQRGREDCRLDGKKYKGEGGINKSRRHRGTEIPDPALRVSRSISSPYLAA